MRNRDLKLSIFYDHIISMSEQMGISVRTAAKMVRDLGIQYIDVNSRFLLNDDSKFWENIKGSGLKIGCICHECDLSELKQYDSEFQIIDISNELGVAEVLILPGLLSDGHTEEKTENMICGINSLCEYAAHKSVTLCIETYDNSASPLSGEGVILFLDKCGLLKCIFDTGNFAFWDESETDYIQKLRNKVVHVHLKDRSLTQNNKEQPIITVSGRELYPCAVGTGIIQMKQIIDKLQDIGYDGIYSIEHYGAEDMYEYIKKSVDWLDSH